jgi:hypothetical protein
MSYLFRHPKTSIYWYRRGVPAGLRPVIGRTEVKRSLGTTDAREAKRLALLVAAEVEDLFAAVGRPVPDPELPGSEPADSAAAIATRVDETIDRRRTAPVRNSSAGRGILTANSRPKPRTATRASPQP